jgi:hypothetical protein
MQMWEVSDTQRGALVREGKGIESGRPEPLLEHCE